MSQGYSLRLIQLNKEADDSRAGVRLGRVCIKRNIPVSVVARRLHVSRQTVYNWFCGVYAPQNSVAEVVERYLAALS